MINNPYHSPSSLIGTENPKDQKILLFLLLFALLQFLVATLIFYSGVTGIQLSRNLVENLSKQDEGITHIESQEVPFMPYSKEALLNYFQKHRNAMADQAEVIKIYSKLLVVVSIILTAATIAQLFLIWRLRVSYSNSPNKALQSDRPRTGH